MNRLTIEFFSVVTNFLFPETFFKSFKSSLKYLRKLKKNLFQTNQLMKSTEFNIN